MTVCWPVILVRRRCERQNALCNGSGFKGQVPHRSLTQCMVFGRSFFHSYPPVPFKEVGLGHVLPPESRIDALGRHAVAELGDVLGVSWLQHGVFKYPVLLSWTTSKRGEDWYQDGENWYH